MVVIVNGQPESGKTTFENYVKQFMGSNFVYIYSTIDYVKELAIDAGWDGSKTPENRKFLSDLKDLLTKWDDVPFKKTLKVAEAIKYEMQYYGIDNNSWILFVDCREPEEIKKLVEATGGKSLLIRRASHEIEASCHADKNVEEFEYDEILENNGELRDWAYTALEWIDKHELRFRHWQKFVIDDDGTVTIDDEENF